MNQVVSGCMLYLRENQRLSPNTLASYERDIRQYAVHLTNLGILDIHQAGKEVLQGYIKTLVNFGKSPSTISRCIASLRIFYRYLIRNGYVEGNPIVGIEAPKLIKKPTVVLSEPEVQKLMEVTGNQGVKNIRDKTIIGLLYETGLKISELIALNIDHVDFDNACLYCSKGSKRRSVPLRSLCLSDLENYIKRSRPYLLKQSNEKALFINSSGKGISRQGIWKIIKKYTHLANMEQDITPHTLRHTLGPDIHRAADNAGSILSDHQ